MLGPVDILLVEDNPGDVRVATEVLEMACIAHELHVVVDGAAAIDYLRRRGAYASATRPDLLLLDLTLPRRGGREVLADVKRDDRLRDIPVVVFSTSDAPDDIAGAFALRADCYLTKPTTFADFAVVAGDLAAFWATRA